MISFKKKDIFFQIRLLYTIKPLHENSSMDLGGFLYISKMDMFSISPLSPKKAPKVTDTAAKALSFLKFDVSLNCNRKY